jgi:Zn-dependent peptidase ImmA (M78 family)/transcriptional regulator with XRE-family HTH domain
MRPGTPGFVGERLTEAREARGLTGVALADLLGVKPQSITYYEQGRATPHPEVMNKLSQCLNLPVSYFMRDPMPPDEAVIFWRSDSSSTRAARSRAEKRLVWLKETMAYLRQFFDFPEVRLPSLTIPTDFRSITGDQLENWAAETRKFWGLGSGPIPDIVAELEANGLVVSQIHVGADNLDAFSQYSAFDRTPYVVLSLDKASAVRCRFDAAHELAHTLIHQKVDRRRINSRADFKLLEDQAHRFAAAFLMPAASFTREVWAASLDTFAAVKPRWGASIAAMIMRCRYLGIVNEDQERRLWINLNRRGWRQEEPSDKLIEFERPRLIRRAIEMLIEAKVRGAEGILLETHLSASDLEDIASLDSGFLKDKTVVVPFPRLREQTDSVGGSAKVISLNQKRRDN